MNRERINHGIISISMVHTETSQGTIQGIKKITKWKLKIKTQTSLNKYKIPQNRLKLRKLKKKKKTYKGQIKCG